MRIADNEFAADGLIRTTFSVKDKFHYFKPCVQVTYLYVFACMFVFDPHENTRVYVMIMC